MPNAKNTEDRVLVALAEHLQPRPAAPPPAASATDGTPPTEEVCSVDPMWRTDRYRLVTPYFSSSRDLGRHDASAH